MIYFCPNCKRVVGKDEYGHSRPSLVPIGGAKLITNKNEPIKVRCVCGRLNYLKDCRR